jgi:uncharacterized membrane protein
MASNNSQIVAILSYILIGIIWFFVDEKVRKDQFAKFHVKQSIVLLIFAIIWGVIIGILGAILWMLWGIWWILGYVPLIFVIIGIVNAVNKKENPLPIIGTWANKLTF